MKKVLLALAVVAFAVACNNSSESTEAKTDSTAVAPVDSAAPAPAVADSTVKTDSAAPAADTTKK